jgi:hypothetical protein
MGAQSLCLEPIGRGGDLDAWYNIYLLQLTEGAYLFFVAFLSASV